MARSLIPTELITNYILYIRGQKVILDSDLAMLYGVSTKRLNEQVKRNRKKFPSDFLFRLTKKEKQKVVAICDHLELMNPAVPTNKRPIGFAPWSEDLAKKRKTA